MSLNYGFESSGYVERHRGPRKLMVLIEGVEKVVYFDDKVLATHDNPHILIKTAIVFWDYNNVTNDDIIMITMAFQDPISKVISANFVEIRVGEGHFDFDTLVVALRREFLMFGVYLNIEMLTPTGKCRVKAIAPNRGVTSIIFLRNIGPLLGFSRHSVIKMGGQWHTSPNKVDMSGGLRQIEVSCDIAETGVITTLLAFTKGSLKGVVQRFVDINTKVPIQKGAHSSMMFRVKPNNGDARIGSVLLELYIV